MTLINLIDNLLFIKNVQINAMLHSNNYVMMLHVFPTYFPITREVSLDSGSCICFIDVLFLQLYRKRRSFKTCFALLEP